MIISGIIILVIILGAVLYIATQKHALQKEKVEFAQLEKERMEEELLQMQEEYGIQVEKIRTGTGYGEQYMHLSSEALLEELGRERVKAERLAEELKLTKASDGKKIKSLRGEIASLRKVLRNYVVQIDSLQASNKKLRKENEQVRKEYNEISRKAGKLSQEKESLTEKVNLAAKLDLSAVSCTPLDKRGRSTNKLNRITHLRFDFTILKNISAKVGMRRIYIRILNPNDMPIVSEGGGTFTYEGSSLYATVSKQIEYGGEDLPETIFWSVDQTLISGTYRADFFTENEKIGRLSFQL